MAESTVDVLIVGGGIAGLVAARELSSRGVRIVLCEARDRLGGRIFTTERPDGRSYELGATWAHWSHPHLWSEITRYDLEYVADAPPSVALVRSRAGYAPVPFDQAETECHDLLERIFAGAGSAFPNPYRADLHLDALADLDHLTITDRLNALDLSDEERDWADSYLPALTGERNEEAGFATLAHWWACAGANAKGWSATFEGGRIRGGMAQLVRAVAQEVVDAGGQIMTSAPVAGISHDGGSSEVTLEGGRRIRSGRVILATPVNTWHRVAFDPPLSGPAAAAAEARGGGARGGHKLILEVEGQLPRFQAVMKGTDALNLVFTFSEVAAGQMLGAYARIGASVPSHDEIVACLDQLGLPLRLVDVHYHDWTSDPFAYGLWTYRGPRALSRDLSLARENREGLVFAGADVNTGLNWVDGAIASGLTAAALTTQAMVSSEPRRTP